MAFDEISALTDLTNELTAGDIIQIKNEIGIPEGLCKDITQESNFILAMKQWGGRDPYKFYVALRDIRPDLLAIACEIKWLCVASPIECEYQEEELSMKTFINLLRHEIPKGKWSLVYIAVANESIENISFEMTLNKLLENGYIQKDLQNLIKVLKGIQRNDVIDQLKAYIGLFSQMEEGEFESKFKKEVGIQEKEMKKWETQLKDFVLIQQGKVQQMLGKDTSMNLLDVYIDLTILNEEPQPIKKEDETTYNEIAMLRRMAKERNWRRTVDFKEELKTYESTKPEIWCLIGNPGCGKTFLAKRTALRFSSSELVGIQYTISIPCRNIEWHSMESTQYENELAIETEYISKWLCLGLPKGPNWSKDLAKHLTESDGEGLLLIIDGIDEFTRKVPFGKTFLCLLLTRQSLTRSTIILTSRPGAWTDISSVHEQKIDRYYQVLGFSPKNRDLYFTKQIKNLSKLKACLELMERHDEMKQLSLIPVNASLFAALLKGEDSASINTLTKLYSELTLYMIRREVTRMGLQEFSRVAQLSDLHPDIQECLKKIGLIAFLGVANRDLMSEENVPLFMGQEEYPSHCLGLAHEHYKKEAVGLVKKVWSFAHLTMQEFTAAHWLSNNTWTEQCYSIRYISHSTDNFSLFKMLVRFLCGILSDKSAAILSIMYRYLTPQPTQLIDIPMAFQFPYYNNMFIYNYELFSQFYLQLTPIFYETNSTRITNSFSHYRHFLPYPIYFYFRQTISPNEWICFLQSLQLLSQIQLIYIETKFINPKQFIDLIEKVKVCSVHYLALEFAGAYSTKLLSSEILAYTDTIRDTQLMVDTKLCLHLKYCTLTNDTAVNIFSPNTNQILSSLLLDGNTYSNECQQQIANQLTALEYIRIGDMDSDIIFSALSQATQLKALFIPDIPYDSYQLRTALPNFSNLQEMELRGYSLLPALSHLSNLTYLRLGINQYEDSEDIAILLQLIFGSRNTLRYLLLYSLKNILTDMDIFLNCLALCTNLVELWLISTDLTAEDITLWSNTVSSMKVLVALRIWSVRLYDTGFESLCAGLAYHPTIRKLALTDAKLTSLSCYPLILLIPIVTQLETLWVSDLKEPDKEAHKLLQQTAHEYSISIELALLL